MRKAFALVLALALLLVSTASAGAAAGAVAFTGRVSGPDGRPVADAQVELFRYGAGRVAVAQTDAGGRYSLSAPPVSGYDYWLRVGATGFALADSFWLEPAAVTAWDATLRPLIGSVYGAVRDTAGAPLAGAEVALVHTGWGVVDRATAGADGTFRFVTVPMGRYQVQAAVAGYQAAVSTVLNVQGAEWADLALAPAGGRVSGEVVNAADNTPVAGARVEIFRRGRGTVAETTTDSRGRYELNLPALTAADYQARVWSDGLAPATSAFFTLPGGTAVDLGQLGTRGSHGAVAGTVTDVAGFPLPGMTVALDQQDVGTVARTTSGRDGSYRFDGLVADGPEYRVRALAEDGAHMAVGSAWFQAGAAAETLEYLVMSPVTSIWGGSAFGKVRGQVTDPAGRPVAGARVELGRDSAADLLFTATTGADGRYEFEQVVPMNGNAAGYRLQVSKEGWVTTAQTAPADDNGIFRVEAGRTVVADVTLHSTGGPLSGQVLDPTGSPVAGVTVVLHEVGKGEVARVATGVGGTYQFARVGGDAGARFRLVAEAPGYLKSDLAAGTDLPLDPVPLPTAAAGAAYDLKLVPAGASVTGQVLGAGGRPVAGATVTARGALGQTWQTETNSGGTYQFTDLIPGMAYEMTASLNGYHAALARVDAPAPGAAATLHLRLIAATGQVAGTVIGPDGALLGEHRVFLTPEGGGAALAATTDANGAFSFANVPAGPGRRYLTEVEINGQLRPLQITGTDLPQPPQLVVPGGSLNLVLMVP